MDLINPIRNYLFVALWLGLGASLSGCPEKEAPEVEKPVRAEAPACSECGEIVGINEVRQKGEGSGAGAVMGAVIGGVIGHQVGGGRGKDAATVAGAAGGAMAGHEIEKRSKSTVSYDVSVRMDKGGTRVINMTQLSGFTVGDKVRVTGDSLQRQS